MLAPVSLLLVDDDADYLTLYRRLFRATGLEDRVRVQTAASAAAAEAHLKEREFPLVLLDLHFPGSEAGGFALLDEIRRRFPATEVLISSADQTFGAAQEALRRGAADYIVKGCTEAEFVSCFERALARLPLKRLERQERQRIERRRERFQILGASAPMRALQEKIAKLAAAETPVLIEAETGAGKELVARNLHLLSGRAAGAFVAVDCGAIPDHLAEALFFGHERGAFTGAETERPGFLEQASGGTLFLDELGSLPLAVQSKLLRALEEKEIRRLGSSRLITTDFRLITAANKDLLKEAESGRFKADLYYRVAVVSLGVPPLRERKGDIPLLAAHFARGVPLSAELVRVLESYGWPGNVRELRNTMHAALALAGAEQPLRLAHLTEHSLARLLGRPAASLPPEQDFDWRWQQARREREFLERAYLAAEGNVSQMARLLKLDRSHLFQKLKKHGIHAPRIKA